MPDILVLDGATVERLLDLDALSAALRDALMELSAGRASVPPRNAAFSSAGLLAAMPGYLPGAGMAVKLVTVFDENGKLGLHSHQALIMLFDPETGVGLAMMDGTYITAVRTAGAAAVAAVALARPESTTLAILGSGVQARTHLDAFTRCFDLAEIRVAARNLVGAQEVADSRPVGRVCASFEEAVRGADIVCCCTNAMEPILRREWLAPGSHVSSVGRGAELDAETVAAGTVFVEWLGAVTNPPTAGAAELQGIDPATVTEVGAVLAKTARGRVSPEQITVYKSTGHAVEDAAAAALVYARALSEQVGARVRL
jgi:alanine dehydrogenase